MYFRQTHCNFIMKVLFLLKVLNGTCDDYVIDKPIFYDNAVYIEPFKDI